ncbi:hypothetical protein [Kangiella geojedonensis]|uniref:Uncharacterized protein n=1 Tax=Kangiella geojedonensis TaxID=914150 RepID=A0A0F6RBZ8_9GAMM|nr:hypothetical protein [Kangiella geojedonensis]AKE51601.1 hypothetical protein TQ33_0623 [Kangiella geojedonensis]
MKLLISVLIALVLGTGFSSVNSDVFTAPAPVQFQADEPPATGNDGEDTSERGLMCRLFGYFC